jgi:hypothetical protein
VVACNGSPTEKISHFVDHFLNPTVLDIKYVYVKDTTIPTYVVEVVGHQPEVLVCLESTFLYTDIPNQKGWKERETFSKKVDQIQVSNYQSCKDILPDSQCLRIRRICSNIHDRYAVFFLHRGCPIYLIEEAATLARSKDRYTPLNPNFQSGNKEEKNKDMVFFI